MKRYNFRVTLSEGDCPKVEPYELKQGQFVKYSEVVKQHKPIDKPAALMALHTACDYMPHKSEQMEKACAAILKLAAQIIAEVESMG